MLIIAIQFLSRFLKILPEPILIGISQILGCILFYSSRSHRRLMLANLSRAFPHKPTSWHKKIALKSAQLTIETGLFVLLSPLMKKKEIQQRFSADPLVLQVFNSHQDNAAPLLILVPHFNLMEAITFLPACSGIKDFPETGVIYRPFFNRSLEKWVKDTRERFGLKLLSRKEGFLQATSLLKKNGVISLLFDQNAGHKGTLNLFFNRVASTTGLPEILANQFNPQIYGLYTERTGFMRAKIIAEKIHQPVTQNMNLWLEKTISKNDNLCSSWLWLHKRWRTQDEPHQRLRLIEKRSELPQTLPKSTRLFIRMPNWLGDVIMALPLIRAIRKSRRDLEITLILSKAFIPLMEHLEVADKFIPLPPKSLFYFKHFIHLRSAYPDFAIQFTNSIRSDIEAYIIGAPQRFGIERTKKPRRLLTHTWKLPSSLNEQEIHQTKLWELYLKNFGLDASLDLSPFQNAFPVSKNEHPSVGLICGTENSPEKRWPIERWRETIELILQNNPNTQITLFGTPRDAQITQQVAAKLPVHDLAGKTNLIQFSENLARQDVILCNDTGGMHLANALGIPTITVYGPTSPIRTGPIFNSLSSIIQPQDCPATGGASISLISAQEVYSAYKNIIQSS